MAVKEIVWRKRRKKANKRERRIKQRQWKLKYIYKTVRNSCEFIENCSARVEASFDNIREVFRASSYFPLRYLTPLAARNASIPLKVNERFGGASVK
ncbi:hypothetical protein NPIL_434761 [Nephila pilipes]|uniref:Uncharacterized protein n=1 Tax=Nephila pilipes TaxID=299642 RepID=A0A8X6M847_NEPPI|nr:hypothetical protein NPIL_434761 [Nephila pilipes]